MSNTQAVTPALSELFNPELTANAFQVKKETLAIWRSTGRYNLPFVRVGRRIFYRQSDIEDWLNLRTQTQTA